MNEEMHTRYTDGDPPPSLVPELSHPFSDINHKLRRIIFPTQETVRFLLRRYTTVVPSLGRTKVVGYPGFSVVEFDDSTALHAESTD